MTGKQVRLWRHKVMEGKTQQAAGSRGRDE